VFSLNKNQVHVSPNHDETWVVPNLRWSCESLQSHMLINDACVLDMVPETMSTDSLKYEQDLPLFSHCEDGAHF